MVRMIATRREFLALCGAVAASAQNPNDTVIATATQDTTPRVGIVLSSFAGGEEHDGSKLPGLDAPKPVDADLDDAFIDAWVRKAIELGAQRATTLAKIVGPDDWLVIKTNIGGETPGAATDPRIVRAVIGYLVENKCAARITIAEAPQQSDAWSKLGYKAMVDELSRQHPSVQFDLADLNAADTIELPVPGGGTGAAATYAIAKIVQQCDKLISIAPIKADLHTKVALTFHNYLGIAPKAKQPGKPEQTVVDLFNYHPADYCILGGPFQLRAGGSGLEAFRHNLLVAGTKAVSVDAIAAKLMGVDPAQVPYLPLAEQSGDHGVADTDIIWTRGNELP